MVEQPASAAFQSGAGAADPVSDQALIARARAGHEGARETLAIRHRQPAYLLALQLLGNREDALDIAQDAMLRFFMTLDTFDAERRVQPWLFTIVRNQVRDLWRQRQRRPGDWAPEAESLIRQLADPAANPEVDLRRQQLRERVWRALATLPTEKREIIVLRDFHDLAYREIAQVLAIPIGTVMSRLHGARRLLRARLEEGGRHV